MFVINAPKNKIDENKIREEKQEKLKKLQEQFLKKNKEISKTMPKSNINNSSLINVGANNSNESKRLKQQLNNSNKKLQELRDKERKYKDTIIKLKNDLASTKKELLETKNINLTLSKKVSNYLIKNVNLEKELEKSKESYELRAFKILFKDIKDKDSKNKIYLREIKGLKNHITKLDQIIDDYKEKLFNMAHDGDITRRDRSYYQNQVRIYATENSKLKKQLLNIEQEYKEKVKSLVNSDLVVAQLRNEINTVRVKKFGNRNKIKNTLGYLKTINNFVFFESIDNKRYLANIDFVEFNEMACCRATIINNIAKITRIYDDKEIFIKELKDISESKRIKKEKRDFSYDESFNYENHFNVLIIGSENKREYTRVLKRAGINVTWFNSYEANVIRLKNMLDRHDIVICCTRHSRHYASYLMSYMQEHDKSNAIKYNLMDKDNTENIIARIRYCIENK